MDKDLARLEAELTSALAGLDAQHTQATPASNPEKWSIQEIVEHLALTWRSTIPAIQSRIEKRSPTRAKPTFQQRLGQFGIITLSRFPPGRAAPSAVSPSLPASLRSGEELSARIKADLQQLDEITAQAEAIFGNSRAASHLVLGPLSMQQWRRFHLVHGLHHVKQITAIRRENGL
jgi:DinB superfamily